MRKSELYEKLLTPFLEKRRMDFPDFVKAFTAGITRMHIGDYIYTEEDFVRFLAILQMILLDIEILYI